METNYITTFKCSGCVDSAAPYLDEVIGKGNWAVDLESPQKILIVFKENVTDEQVQEAVRKAGYSVERVAD